MAVDPSFTLQLKDRMSANKQKTILKNLFVPSRMRTSGLKYVPKSTMYVSDQYKEFFDEYMRTHSNNAANIIEGLFAYVVRGLAGQSTEPIDEEVFIFGLKFLEENGHVYPYSSITVKRRRIPTIKRGIPFAIAFNIPKNIAKKYEGYTFLAKTTRHRTARSEKIRKKYRKNTLLFKGSIDESSAAICSCNKVPGWNFPDRYLSSFIYAIKNPKTNKIVHRGRSRANPIKFYTKW